MPNRSALNLECVFALKKNWPVIFAVALDVVLIGNWYGIQKVICFAQLDSIKNDKKRKMKWTRHIYFWYCIKIWIENNSRAKIQYTNLFLMLYLNLLSLFHCPWAFWAKCALAYLSLCLMITENFTNLLANQKVH